MIRVFFRVQGIVQGVGFRPFVALLARRLGLVGHVENTTRGVEIEVQGPKSVVDAFRRELVEGGPPMAAILSLEAEEVATGSAETGFEIRASRVDPVASAVIPPDIATCDACRLELFDPTDRRCNYPFLNCTNCGPRYTIIASIPYDRARTSMAAFPMCMDCTREYEDPRNRRFHAQPNACPACGPRLALKGPAGEDLPGDALEGVIGHLSHGGIVALMGLGGFHLACDATREEVVAELRRRKVRPGKPFAVMVPGTEVAREVARVDPETDALLRSPRAPILLVPSRPRAGIAPAVAPGQDRVGLFLPYTPVHHLLFHKGGFRALVMTSGNRSDEPILATWAEAREKLAGVADCFLVHDRPILHRVDDSVVKPMGTTGPIVIRRARSYAPAPVALGNPRGQTVLAVGGELANTFAVARGDFAYLGPHIGDIKNLDAEEAFRSGIEHLLGLLQVEPETVACDLHPGYRSSVYAEEWEARGIEVLRVQHHEAHAAACMAENRFQGEGITLALDGLGYGWDGTLWGGEILAGRPGQFARSGHLVAVPQPGGDRAAVEPWRMAASHLRRILGAAWRQLPLPTFQDRAPQDLAALDGMMEQGLQSPLTSSCGRLFDAAAAILGFRGRLLYSAQAAMELEALAAGCSAPAAPYPAKEPDRLGPLPLLDPASLLECLLSDALGGRDAGQCAVAFHAGLARLFALGAEETSRRTGLKDVFLTGGCVQNGVFVRFLHRELTQLGLSPHTHREVPPNDGGLSYGQLAWAIGCYSSSASGFGRVK